MDKISDKQLLSNRCKVTGDCLYICVLFIPYIFSGPGKVNKRFYLWKLKKNAFELMDKISDKQLLSNRCKVTGDCLYICVLFIPYIFSGPGKVNKRFYLWKLKKNAFELMDKISDKQLLSNRCKVTGDCLYICVLFIPYIFSGPGKVNKRFYLWKLKKNAFELMDKISDKLLSNRCKVTGDCLYICVLFIPYIFSGPGKDNKRFYLWKLKKNAFELGGELTFSSLIGLEIVPFYL